MDILEILDKKRTNQKLTKEEINYFVDGYVKGSIADYQASAMTMAICINGLKDEETIYLTDAMIRSGDIMDLSKIKGIKVDKHSTGGVSDTTSIALVQTLIGTPAIIHGGPFANIAHGCNSIIATNTALGCASYVITEAGFGADLGAEKFFDVKCRKANLKPDAVVLVCTIKALKYNGGVEVKDLQASNVDAVVKGSVNLIKHIKNIKEVYKLPLVVAINRFASDSEEEIEVVKNIVNKFDVDCEAVDVFGQGGQGALGLVDKVIKACDSTNEFTFAYQDDDDIVTKCTKVACKIYGASGVELTEEAKKDLEYIQGLGKAHYPVVIAKTQYSLSDDPKALGAPSDFKLKIRAFELRNGAEFIVAIAGDIMLMPGLSREPRATKMICNQDDFNLA